MNKEAAPHPDPSHPTSEQTARASPGVPNIAWIRRSIPIADVARKLDLTVIAKMVRCWRPSKHQNSDRTPSVGLDSRTNKARCFVCDPRQYSNIDLVEKVLGIDTRRAVLWFARNFEVPCLPKGTHMAESERWHPNYRAGVRDDPLHWFVKSGVYATLSPAGKVLLPVLLSFVGDDDEITISYRGLMRYAGLGSTASISRALKEFQGLHILKRTGEPRDKACPVLRNVGQYRLTLNDADVLAFAEEIFQTAQKDIVLEREIRREARQRVRHDPRNKNHASPIEQIKSIPAAVLPVSLSSTSEALSNMTPSLVNRETERQDVRTALPRVNRKFETSASSGSAGSGETVMPETESIGSAYVDIEL
jgi:hypothetical protein